MNLKLFILLIFLLSGCIPAQNLEYGYIDTSCNLTLVEGEINGKKTYFVIDTGAGVTTLDINQSKHFGFSFTDSELSIGGINNDIGEAKQAIGIASIKVNGTDIAGEDIIYTNDMGRLTRFVETCAKKRIGGIIGVPVIRRYGLVIDLLNSKLYMHAANR
ncbi:MAG TPA: hypothetical protein VGQ09_15095 [Chitinophagaceae bacterium]|jgi:hypothetical protein|nr:hypothetical protein [Chitinophagaceae bacterium]